MYLLYSNYICRCFAGADKLCNKLQTDVAGLPGSRVGRFSLRSFRGAPNTLPPEWGLRGDGRLKYITKQHGGSESFKWRWKWEVSRVTFRGLKNWRQHEGKGSASSMRSLIRLKDNAHSDFVKLRRLQSSINDSRPSLLRITTFLKSAANIKRLNKHEQVIEALDLIDALRWRVEGAI